MTTVAIMQPYFVPYAGYFRLLAAADVFVILDTVQFPRRGWVHRNRLPNRSGEPEWFTIPLQGAPQTTAIADMQIAPDAGATLRKTLARFPVFDAAAAQEHALVRAVLHASGNLEPYLTGLLAQTCQMLDLPFRTVRASELGLPDGPTGQARILQIAEHLKATRYLNAPGGTDLYEAHEFELRGIELRFLAPYTGATWSVLYRLLTEDPRAIAAELKAQA